MQWSLPPGGRRVAIMAKKKKDQKPTGEKARKLVNMAKDWYDKIVMGQDTETWRDNAIESKQFYQGTGQWDAGAKRLLQLQGRPSLTINRILPIINVIWGGQLKTRQEIKLYARRGGSMQVANLGSSLIQHAMDTCNGYDALSDCFRDGCVTGKGWATIDRIFDNDPFNGDVDIESPDPLFMYEDPRNPHYDINRGEFVFRERVVTRTDLEPYYPDIIDDIFQAMTNDWSKEWLVKLATTPGSTVSMIANVFTQNADYGEGSGGDTYTSTGDHLKAAIVRECWYRTKDRVTVASLMLPDGQVRRTRITEKADRDKLEHYMERNPDRPIVTVDAIVPTLHLLTMVGDMLLKHEDDPLNGMHIFPYTRFAPYWMHGDAFGVIDNLKDPQREHNKNRSTATHLMNQAGNTGWMAGKATTEGRRMIEAFGSTPGVLLEKAEFGGILDRIKPEQLNQGWMTLAELAPADMEKISGANPDMFGSRTEQVESGRARRLRMEAGQTAAVPMLANMARTQNIFGNTLWQFIRHNNVYSPEEVLAVTDESIIEDLGGPEAAVETMNAWDTGNYSVKADTTPSSTTYREAMIEEVRAVAMFFLETGLQMPPEMAQELVKQVIQMSSFPGRDKIVDMLKRATLQPTPEGPQAGARKTTEAGAAL